MVEILMPNAERQQAALWLGAERLSSLDGRTVGIVNNSWRCMNVIANELTARLTAEYGVVDILEERISAAQTLPGDRLRAMADQCDAVVVGIGN